MTVAIGVSPADGAGAVLLTDSLIQERRPGGVRAMLCLTPRFERLHGAQGAAIISAMTRGGWAPCSTASGIEAAVAELSADLGANLATRPWRFADGREVAPRGVVVAAGTGQGGVRLVRQRTGDRPEWAEPGSVIVDGAAADVDVRPEPPPDSLEACATYALDLARAILAEDRRVSGYATLDGALEAGAVPAMGGALWVAAITSTGVDIRRCDQ